jgi:hypothetical protein
MAARGTAGGTGGIVVRSGEPISAASRRARAWQQWARAPVVVTPAPVAVTPVPIAATPAPAATLRQRTTTTTAAAPRPVQHAAVPPQAGWRRPVRFEDDGGYGGTGGGVGYGGTDGWGGGTGGWGGGVRSVARRLDPQRFYAMAADMAPAKTTLEALNARTRHGCASLAYAWRTWRRAPSSVVWWEGASADVRMHATAALWIAAALLLAVLMTVGSALHAGGGTDRTGSTGGGSTGGGTGGTGGGPGAARNPVALAPGAARVDFTRLAPQPFRNLTRAELSRGRVAHNDTHDYDVRAVFAQLAAAVDAGLHGTADAGGHTGGASSDEYTLGAPEIGVPYRLLYYCAYRSAPRRCLALANPTIDVPSAAAADQGVGGQRVALSERHRLCAADAPARAVQRWPVVELRGWLYAADANDASAPRPTAVRERLEGIDAYVVQHVIEAFDRPARICDAHA